ncbi:ABC transporter ATP-binding protein [Microscilla marina]|uniref:ABC transporter, ATP-binding protein n=1 Tax=Microscilla marina ATCC 23134 TaxID=313606 RepID=A1ZR56_MICM2|nr:ATP-binding cassette domain-containing protein [Microscilla marina]EAY27145.1 ABC transporter, ATP-binding protein [Microscilla marina ATCC 23134]
MQKNIIETHQLDFSFGKFKVLHNLSLKVPQASIYGFLGPNGAGKTTTIRILLGLIKTTKGKVSLFNQDLNNHRVEILRKIGALVEMPSLYPHLSGRKNLEITRTLIGNIDKKRIDEVLEIVGLSNDAHRRVKQYSLGMKQRLGLALSFLNDPDLLILDEPTNGLDPNGIKEIRELIIRLNQEFQKTIFVSSHLLSEVEKVATHVGIIHQGKLHFEGSIGELREQQKPSTLLEVNDSDKAAEILTDQHIPIIGRQNGTLKIEAHEHAVIHQVNSSLLKAGLEVYQLSPQESSLEDLFMDITQNPR